MRILVVQTAFLGDIVLSTPLFRELRRVHPDARLIVLTTASGHKTLSHVPGIDEWLILDKRWDRSGLRSYGRVMSRLIAGRFDAAVAAQRSVRTGMFIRLSGAPLRVGFAGAPGAWAYNRKVEWEPGKHAVRRYLELSAPLGGDPRSADPQPALSVAPPAARRADALLRASGVDPEQELICIAPGSVWGTKRWIPEGFAAVVDASPSMGLTPVLIGSPDELELCRTVSRLSAGGATVLAGVTDIPELVALVARSRILVGNDSGAAHVAAAVGTPVVSVFGPTVPEAGYTAFGSLTRVVELRGLECRPCGRHGAATCPLKHFRCMRELDADRVLEQIARVLGAPSREEREIATLGSPA